MRYRLKMWDDAGKPLFEVKDEDPDQIIERMKKAFDKKMK